MLRYGIELYANGIGSLCKLFCILLLTKIIRLPIKEDSVNIVLNILLNAQFQRHKPEQGRGCG